MIQSSAQALVILQDQHLPENPRTEAAHFLATDASANSIAALVTALRDADHGVRWAAGTALALLGEPAMHAVLSALLQPNVGKTLRDGVLHVLTDNRSAHVRLLSVPLVKALKGPEADIAAMQEAAKLLPRFR